ncbi:MAG TPA: hypothetical protein VG714_00460 [Acidobacteriaceae bacterium]|nr:hypothetical protein [Acidobacteriaceae bacterium]
MEDQKNRNEGSFEGAIKGQPVSRRWLLRNTANAAAGAIAVTALGAGATEKAVAGKASVGTAYPIENVHVEQPQGYVHSLHGWDTI